MYLAGIGAKGYLGMTTSGVSGQTQIDLAGVKVSNLDPNHRQPKLKRQNAAVFDSEDLTREAIDLPSAMREVREREV